MFTIYSKPNCPQCDKAKMFLKTHSLHYSEKVLDMGQPKSNGVAYYTKEQLLEIAPTARTVPQVTVQGDDGQVKLIGGYQELAAFVTENMPIQS